MTQAEGRALIRGRPAHRHDEAGPGDIELWPRIEVVLHGQPDGLPWEELARAVGGATRATASGQPRRAAGTARTTP